MVDLAALGLWLELMILEVLSNLNDSVTLCFYDFGSIDDRDVPPLQREQNCRDEA